MDTSILQLSIFCWLLLCVTGCKVRDWRHMSTEELLFGADIVVTGTDLRHITYDLGSRAREDSEFRVSCIFKGDGETIEEVIRIEDVGPGMTCWDPDLQVGETYIVGLQRTETGYREHHVNVQQNASFPASDENIMKALRVCGLQEISLPKGMDEAQRPTFCHNPRSTNDCYGFPGMPGQGVSAHFTKTAMLGTLTLSFVLTYVGQSLQ